MKRKEENSAPVPETTTEVKIRRPRRTQEQLLQAALDNLNGLREKLVASVTEATQAVDDAVAGLETAQARLAAFDAARGSN